MAGPRARRGKDCHSTPPTRIHCLGLRNSATYLETTRSAHPIASAFRADWPAAERPCVRWWRRTRRASVQQIRPDRSPMPASLEQAYLRRWLLQPVFSSALPPPFLLLLSSRFPHPPF